MASSDRLNRDIRGTTMVPMSIDAQYDTTAFMNVPKALVLGGVVFAYILVIAWGKSANFNILGWVVIITVLTLISQLLIRKVVFQERYFFKQWKERLLLGTPKATHFWSSPYTQKTSLGDVLVFSDLRMGVVIELEKDTIVGTSTTNKEKHYDSWSDFYRYLFANKFSLVQLNLMQPTGKDDRFEVVSDEVRNARNPNIKKLLTASLGHIRTISNTTLDEYEYVLVHTKQNIKAEEVISHVLRASQHLLDGSYREVRILNESEIFKLPRWNFNTLYFDGVDAQMGVYRNSGVVIKEQLKLDSIILDNGEVIELTDIQRGRLERASKLLDTRELSYLEWDIQRALNGDFEQTQAESYTQTAVSSQSDETKTAKKLKVSLPSIKQKKSKKD